MQKEDNFWFDEKYEGYSNKELIENSYLFDKVFQYNEPQFEHVKMVAEPTNEYDSEAIAIYIEDLKVGHVPQKNFIQGKKRMNEILASGVEYGFTLNLTGGKYKEVNEFDEVVTKELTYGLRGRLAVKKEKEE